MAPANKIAGLLFDIDCLALSYRFRQRNIAKRPPDVAIGPGALSVEIFHSNSGCLIIIVSRPHVRSPFHSSITYGHARVKRVRYTPGDIHSAGNAADGRLKIKTGKR